MKWLKRAELNVLGYSLALSLIPSVITWGMGEFSFRHVSANNAYWMVIWNISVYMVMFFGILSLASTKEKTRPRLLAAGLGMILLGIFSASNCADLLLKLTQLNSVDNERTVVFSGLLQNICLYLSAAVGGGIVSSSIFGKEESKQKTEQAPETKVQPVQDSAQEKPAQQPVAPVAAEEKEVEQES
ncbi:hypothetical protein ACUXVY_16170 [Chromobacterium haemolyticum]|uniref:hypothetical protein n=1 Tax=Chromobacterium haemolyticum TaxID=394935 RepID=UPI0040569762